MRENQRLNGLTIDVTATGGNPISSLTLFDADGAQLSNPVPVGTAPVSAVFTSADFIQDITFTRDVRRTLIVRGNISTAGSTSVALDIDAVNINLVGLESGTALTGLSAVNFVITSPFAGGTFSTVSRVATLERATASPAGAISRATQSTTGIWDIRSSDALNAPATITGITFTSRTGLPSTLPALPADAAALFRLQDDQGNVLVTATPVVAQAAGTVTFGSIAGLSVGPGEVRQVRLLVNTTNTAHFPSNSQLHWSVETVGAVTVTGGEAGFAAGIWSIPATANIVTIQ